MTILSRDSVIVPRGILLRKENGDIQDCVNCLLD